MAVYKATYCYPHLKAVDIRTALGKIADSDDAHPAQYLKCKVDTSNKDVTGYSIRLLDESNNVLFPLRTKNLISPISELKSLAVDGLYEENGVNSGVNGTYLKIPFFQNSSAKRLDSINAVYFIPKAQCDYVIGDADASGDELLSVWTKDSDGSLYIETSDAPSVNGGVLTEGDVVLSVSSESTSATGAGMFLWEVGSATAPESGVRTPMSPLKIFVDSSGAATNQFPSSAMAAVLKGNRSSYIYRATPTTGYERLYESSVSLWGAYDDSGALDTVDGLSVDGLTVKWEITLYQGSGAEKTLVWTSAKYMDYSGLKDGDCDMVLSSGMILGSTPERIQIADDDENELPQGQNGTLVLQGRYMDLSNPSSFGASIFNGTRVYVESYDATYGHAYPISGDLESTVVDNCTQVQFFKHSNSPDAVLASDKVDFGVDKAITLTLSGRMSDRVEQDYHSEEDWLSMTTASQRLIAISDGEAAKIGPIETGDSVLLTAQSDAKWNGVWQYYDLTLFGATYHCLKRATGYLNWGSYIGKVIYCANGTLTGNVESLANGGTYVLWNPMDATSSGGSELHFSREMPIMLFPQLLPSQSTFARFDSANEFNPQSSHTADFNSPIVDGETVQEGDLILYKNLTVGIVDSVSADRYSIYDADLTVGYGNLFYVTGGGEYGHRVWKKADSASAPVADWTLYTARILKNGPDFTYVSPFIGLKAGMKMKISGGKKATLADGAATPWLTVKSVDPTTYRVTHETLSEKSAGVEPNTNRYGFASRSSDASGTPWKYEIRSYFKTSDENVVYLYSSPYVNAYVNGSFVSSSSASRFYQNYITSDGDEYDVSSGSADYLPYLVKAAEADSGMAKIHSRCAEVSAEYVQRDGLSWESYRWILADADGNELQDTGKRYDKKIACSFYGLSNDTKKDVTYYAILYIEDSLGTVSCAVVKISVAAASGTPLQMPFSAEFDCRTQSVLLSYQNYSFVPPSYLYDVSRMGSYSDGGAFWDGGLVYNSASGGELAIVDKNGNDKVIVDSPYGSTLDGSDRVLYSSYVSYATSQGCSYSHAFPKDESYSDISDGSAALRLDGDDDGTFHLRTEVSLDDDFCGDVLTVNLESSPNTGGRDPYAKTTDEENESGLAGYLTVSLRLPDVFTGDSNNQDELNENRNKLELAVAKYGDGEKGSTYFSTVLFDIPTSPYYYMQFMEILDVAEFARYSFHQRDDDTNFLWKAKDGLNRWFAPYERALGNLNLTKRADSNVLFNDLGQSKQAPSYWSEDRVETSYSKAPTDYFYWHSDKNDAYINYGWSTEKGALYWPEDSSTSSVQEANHYWNENGDLSENTEIFWEDVDADTLNMAELLPSKRHPGLSRKKLSIAIDVNNIKSMYDKCESLTFAESDSTIKIYSDSNKTDILGSVALVITETKEEEE